MGSDAAYRFLPDSVGDRWERIDAPLLNPSLAQSDDLVADHMAEVAAEWWLLSESSGHAMVVVGFGRDLVLVGDARVVWQGPGSPMLALEEVRVLPTAAVERFPELMREAVRLATIRRRSRFKRCRTCREKTAPEHREGTECHSCMEKRGVVF